MDINEFSYLWNKNNDYDVLIKVSNGYSIFNKNEHTILLIEDEELESIIIKKMIENHKQIFNSVNEAL